ncbi:MAG: hypothetical protein ACI88A_002966 [Paraglaciecola sp.]|jgi:hypothetical protein
MGYTRTIGTSNAAPKYKSNTIGIPIWSSVHEEDFTPEMERKLRLTIAFEAKLQGNNDSAQGRVGENEIFFHNEFLSDWLQKLWKIKYQEGDIRVSNLQYKPSTISNARYWYINAKTLSEAVIAL